MFPDKVNFLAHLDLSHLLKISKKKNWNFRNRIKIKVILSQLTNMDKMLIFLFPIFTIYEYGTN